MTRAIDSKSTAAYVPCRVVPSNPKCSTYYYYLSYYFLISLGYISALDVVF